MNIYLAGISTIAKPCFEFIKQTKPYALESYFYMNRYIEELIPYFSDFLLDSGAFSFMSNTARVDWNEYIIKYADFINRNNIKKYFELDIDNIVGFDTVLEFRRRLEEKTGKKCIPVWHKSRGMTEFYKMCNEYKYVAIGGIVSKEIKQSMYKSFPYLISEAHKRGVKIHALGFTNIKLLPKYHFDSVDSTAWLSGGRFGTIYQFNNKIMITKKRPEGCRVRNLNEAHLHNYKEWIKYQKYAEVNL